MATLQYSALNLQNIPLQGLRIENLASAPGSPALGMIYYDTALGYMRQYIGAGAWVKSNVTAIVDADIAAGAAIALTKLATDPLARANHTGTQLAATISDFNTAVRLNRLDQLAAPTAPVAMGSQRITGLADPSGAQDAATQNYVLNQIDARVNAQDWKASVRVRAGANVTVSAPGANVDAVAMAANDRVLLAGQTTPSENGIYVWNGAATPMTRATDADTSAEVTTGMTVPVSEGTSADTIWLLTTNDAITLGTTGLAFTQIGAAGATYTAGTGLSLAGNQFSITAPVTVALGGTNATTAAGARTSLGVPQTGFAADVGAMSAGTGLVIAHGRGTADLVVEVRDKASGQLVGIDTVVDATNITLTSAVAVSAAALRVVANPAA